MKETLPFRMLRPWLAERFGGVLHRVALDAGSDCPNRDGTKGRGGCVYCDVEGSGTGALRSGIEIRRQLEQGILRVQRRAPDCGVIAYLQSYSNTYVSESRLRQVLDAIEPFVGRPVMVLAIATRPDTLPNWALSILSEWNRRLPVWIELGLETADDRLLVEINRHHTVADFLEATARVRAAGMEAIGHAILGLPGDGREGARKTAEVLATSGVQGVKVHQLMILRRTILEKRWREGELLPLDEPTYLDWLSDFVERLQPEQVLHRLAGDAKPSEILAPLWSLDRNDIRNGLARELERRGTRQGSLYGNSAEMERG